MLRVRLVGELGRAGDGRPLEPPAPAKARALLAWLALHPGEHPRSEVAGTFWPDVLEESARASLRTALSAVGGSLGGAAVGRPAPPPAPPRPPRAGRWGCAPRGSTRGLSNGRPPRAGPTPPSP